MQTAIDDSWVLSESNRQSYERVIREAQTTLAKCASARHMWSACEYYIDNATCSHVYISEAITHNLWILSQLAPVYYERWGVLDFPINWRYV